MQDSTDFESAAKSVLFIFAKNSYSKTSMEDIGRAANLSRQSIYKKFGSKGKSYEWALNTYLAEMYGRIFTTLKNKEMDPKVVVDSVFVDFVGESIDLVANPFGTEVLRDALEAAFSSEEDWPLRFRARLGDFLHQNNMASSHEAGEKKAFALITAAKGLILEYKDRDRARKDMMTVLDAVADTAL